MRVAVCGFKAFAGVAVNPSRQIVESLERKHRSRGDRSLSFHLLETAYDEDSRRIREVVAEAPDVLVIIGVARHRQSICFERFAVNIDDATVPDRACVSIVGGKSLRMEASGKDASISIECLKEDRPWTWRR